MLAPEVDLVERVDRPRAHAPSPRRRPQAPAALFALTLAGGLVFALNSFGGPSDSGQLSLTDETSSAPAAADADLALGAAPVTSAAVVAVAPTTVPQPAVETDGCQLEVISVKLGDTGDAAECVQRALAVAGAYTGPIDGTFSAEVDAAAKAFQSANDLYVDGVVGRQTAEQLGIWPGDESFVVHTPPPAAGAMDLEGYELSSVASAGSDAPPLPPNAGQGTGRRIVYSRLHQRVWAINDDEQIVRSYLVSGSQYNNEVPGKHEVYSRSDMTTGWNGQADLPMMVRWLDTERGAIGFHQIPFHKSDGSVYQSESELGQRLSGGCQRQAHLDAVFMWHFGQIGTPVIVL